MPLSLRQAKCVGKKLFNAVFKGEVYTLLELSIAKVRRESSRLRLRFKLTGVPELSVLPWEYLYNEQKNHFYVHSVETPIVRFLNKPDEIENLLANTPLRILVIISNPANTGLLNVEEEWKDLKEAFKDLEEKNLVEIERLERATLEALDNKLSFQPPDEPYHILHYIGHSEFDKNSGVGRLLFQNDEGNAHPLSAEWLANTLNNYRTIRLVILNSCEGASISATDSYAGTAQHLLRQANIPAVIAMQYEITDKAALKFSKRFYNMLANGQPIDGALSQARMAIYAQENETEWAVPVLYMRSESGDIVNYSQSDNNQASVIVKPQINPSKWDKHFEAVVNAILLRKIVPFIGLDVNLYGRQEKDDWQPGDSLPGSRELAKYLAQSFGYPLSEIPDLISVSQYAVVNEKGKMGRLHDCFSDIFNRQYEPTPLHKLLAEIPQIVQSKKPATSGDYLQRFIITTSNYDNILENLFRHNNSVFHVVTYITNGKQSGRFYHTKFSGSEVVLPLTPIKEPVSYSALTDNDPIILKLPGTVEADEQRFAITEDHYSDYLTYRDLSGLLPRQVKGKLKSSHHLFLGSSLRNWHLRALLYRVWEGREPSYASWAVHPNPPPIDSKFWEASDVEVVDENFDSYINELRNRLLNA
ncbi:MAG TPA: CHAT domain-containing protein [Pyrinomonadaceae bacterium]